MERKMMGGSFFLWMAGHAISCDEARAPLLRCQQFLTGVAAIALCPLLLGRE
ncbi:hypothetical protein SLEP1_g42811 [Rubroshorea leprosula]|uniref:Uncharacterized protein n=1 Tax=Rubroshorea leprosula TaxID=152421 RepID=A0AAV5LC16_9ROSI|nr:hypothetical protein SLEP1_g42811 [Rubroshorea leprosula]